MVLAGPYGCVRRSWTTYLKKYFLAWYLKLFIRTHCVLALSLGFWSLWLVWDLWLKFLRGSTTTVHEQEQRGYLALPHFLLCNKQRYKTDELADMELPEDFFDNWTDRTKLRYNDSFPDLNATWNRATWAGDDIGIDYRRYEGKVTNIW